ncbi:N-carbamoyl-L-amino acid hydrolase [Halomonadaceae bacterium LMG 33818]|uniref:allantoate amidohydrolase n=1 Tax=Cernens ardua TaxID=3402176 RepID=UPI003EDC7F10
MKTAQEVMAACDTLARISASESGIERVYLSPQHREANELVQSWAKKAGLEAWQDGAGNLCMRLEGRQAGLPALLLGSHLDTVPNAGRYDGILGVMIALSVIERLKDRAQSLPFALEAVGFADEEGTRFGVTLLGSAALAGEWQSSWWDIKDAQGITIREAFLAFGLNPDNIGEVARTSFPQEGNDPKDLSSGNAHQVIAYLEAHIEQGPVLEAKDEALGVVTSIAGARRFEVHVKGVAGHAGTTPFELRHDALCAASQMILSIEQMAKESDCVATVGQLEVLPGAVNVIPGDVHFSIDIRSAEDQSRDTLWNDIKATLETQAKERRVGLTIRQTHSAGAQACAEVLQSHIAQGIRQTIHHAPISLFSGAGHDAMVVGKLTDIGMLFIRCEKGLSHHPAESVEEADVALAIDAMEKAVLSLAASYD